MSTHLDDADSRRSHSLEELTLMAAVASLFYRSGLTRIQIADQLGLSRFKVARVLDEALAAGVVRIEISVPESIDADLSIRLERRFGLRRAIVVSVDGRSDEAVEAGIGRAAARLMSETVRPDDTLGITAGRSIDALTSHLTDLPACDVVQLNGMSGSFTDNPVDVIRRVSGIAGGRAHTIFAPLVVASAETAADLKLDPAIAETYARMADVTVAYMAIGSWSPPRSRLYDALSERNRNELLAFGVAADICGALIADSGATVEVLDPRVIGLTAEQIRAIPEVVGVAGGRRKFAAIRAVLQSGLLQSLVTDAEVARWLLAQDPEPAAGVATH